MLGIKEEVVKLSDLEYFYSNILILQGLTTMFIYKDKTYYYNTYAFCTYLKNLYTIKEQKNIKLVVNPYLIGIVTIQQNIIID